MTVEMTSFTLYPAIDLKGGKCVRLLHGEMDKATVYNEDPASQAQSFLSAGFEWVHIVDLDGAFSGKAENAGAVERIIKNTSAKLQIGGGIRSVDAVSKWIDLGMTRVILGTAAVRDPEFVIAASKQHPQKVVIGVDAKDGRVKTDGWAGDSEYSALDIVKRFEDAGVAAVIYTDIGRDGALTGVNVEATAALAEAVTIPVIASGGVAGPDDIDVLAAHKANIEGVIIGRALYDGRIDPADGLARAKAAR